MIALWSAWVWVGCILTVGGFGWWRLKRQRPPQFNYEDPALTGRIRARAAECA